MGEYLSKTKEYLHTQADLGERTRKKYLTVAERYFKANEHLTVEAANKFILSTIKHSRSYYIKAAFKYMFAAIGRPEDYEKLAKIRIKESAPKAVYVEKEDLLRIIGGMKTKRHKIVATIQYCTGIRANDAFGIRKKYVLYEKDMVRLKLKQKGGDERIVYVPKPYAGQVFDYIERADRVYPLMREFVITGSRSIEKAIDSSYHAYWRELRAVAATLGYEGFSTHDFRRNYIDAVYDKTKDVIVTRSAAGHSKVETTLRYINKHTDPEKVKNITKEVRGE